MMDTMTDTQKGKPMIDPDDIKWLNETLAKIKDNPSIEIHHSAFVIVSRERYNELTRKKTDLN